MNIFKESLELLSDNGLLGIKMVTGRPQQVLLYGSYKSKHVPDQTDSSGDGGKSFNVGFILVSSIRQMFPHAPNSHIMKAVNCISQNVC